MANGRVAQGQNQPFAWMAGYGIAVHDATWSPDGQQIAYARGTGLFRANGDGTESRKLTNVPGILSQPRWSPDGVCARGKITNR